MENDLILHSSHDFHFRYHHSCQYSHDTPVEKTKTKDMLQDNCNYYCKIKRCWVKTKLIHQKHWHINPL